ncbi:MAG: hypothetical protein QXY62_05055 [Candidatus Altiarchaeota archaeon]
MGLKEIEKEIEKKAELEIKKIEEEGEKALSKLREDIEKISTEQYQQTKLKKKKELEIEIRRLISNARMMKKNKIALKKAEILERVFQKAKEKILEMNDEEKRKILENLAKDRDKFPNSIILIDKKYASLLRDAKTSEIGDFGIVIESKEGHLRIERTLSKLIEQLRVRLEPEIVKILFK